MSQAKKGSLIAKRAIAVAIALGMLAPVLVACKGNSHDTDGVDDGVVSSDEPLSVASSYHYGRGPLDIEILSSL